MVKRETIDRLYNNLLKLGYSYNDLDKLDIAELRALLKEERESMRENRLFEKEMEQTEKEKEKKKEKKNEPKEEKNNALLYSRAYKLERDDSVSE